MHVLPTFGWVNSALFIALSPRTASILETLDIATTPHKPCLDDILTCFVLADSTVPENVARDAAATFASDALPVVLLCEPSYAKNFTRVLTLRGDMQVSARLVRDLLEPNGPIGFDFASIFDDEITGQSAIIIESDINFSGIEAIGASGVVALIRTRPDTPLSRYNTYWHSLESIFGTETPLQLVAHHAVDTELESATLLVFDNA